MKSLLLLLLLSAGFSASVFAQSQDEILKKKTINDTLLKTDRSLIVPEPFNAQKVLLQLFPGKYYNLSKGKYNNELINWECNTCKTQTYTDVNEDGIPQFPYQNGVATRLLNVMDYQDSTGVKYKVISFNHSEFDEDGAMTSRFTGGLLGLAKFVFTNGAWKLRIFQPAIGAYGAFSHCPDPKLVLIGQNQYAFMIKHSNGGAGGPFDGSYFLIAGTGGAYRQVLATYGVERTEVSEEEGLSSWTSEYSVPASSKKFFRDVLITIKGTYKANDKEVIPPGIKDQVKGMKVASFKVIQRYVYKGSKGYELEQPVKATFTKLK
ncbi:hypothetical protein SAMN05421821_10671 [Mucilaginibacter lappiensis]|uniref:Uncharacterized protein n=1 Tax=Mucilaginibacter lappiensis TaxID=354630 RepID=A0ABR6PM19_9SPHI|nr:hypothetical protein [Mucilaginibacter lappiensis]MBB6110264.1 hypothetical protein [Mucilaginibacter lappiensis]SIR28355.1 hypothetical protein SAMN05421821_10671 [Mucilaginibacter lappiensis]